MTALAFLPPLQSQEGHRPAAVKRLHPLSSKKIDSRRARESKMLSPEEQLASRNRLKVEASTRPQTMAGRYPLAPAQERLWFMDQLAPDTALYNEAIALRLAGALNVSALRQALNELVRRHEVLRTSFDVVNGQPYQCVATGAQLILPVMDLCRSPRPERDELARELARRLACQPFDLSQQHLLRAGLIKLAPEEHLLVISLHHIICDGWSKGVLIQELYRLYEAYGRGEASPLTEPELHYADFAAWQKERINRGDLDAEMDYWRQELGGSLPSMDMPGDHARPPVPSYRGAAWGFELSPEVSQGVKALSRSSGVTSYMVLLAAWQMLLGRYCAQNKVAVGSVAANRGSAALENIVGLMVNTLVIQGDLTGNPTFKRMLARVKAAAVGAYKHQELPYEKLVAELAVGRDSRRRPLVDVMFVMEQGLMGQAGLSGLTVSEEQIDLGTAKYDLMMVIQETGGRFTGRIHYSTDLFNEPKIKRMAEAYQRLLAAAVADPNRRLSELPVLTESEQRMLLDEWNDTDVAYATDKNLSQMFEAQVVKTPDAIAVVYADEQLTYRELNRRANLLADDLRRLGVKPGSLVGLCVERSLKLCVGVLAILKAGGAYLPLDANYPLERLRFMLAEACSPVLLTETHLLERLPDTEAVVICMEAGQEIAGNQCSANPVNPATGDDLAYVVYTSGSTGKPKGVSLSQGTLANLMRWHTGELEAKARTLQFASPSFDVSFYELFATWLSGGTLFIAPEAFRQDIPQLAGFLASHEIEKMVLPVVVLQQLAEEHRYRKQLFRCLREVITTGEQLQITRPIVSFFEDFSSCSLHNHYGPSESHVVTALPLRGEPASWATHPCIGRPIANARMYLLDQLLSPTPLGTLGELHIGGVALARGYLNRPDLTAERFVPDPFSPQPGGRLYKTGDLARYLEDGNIEFVGRADHQVKIRGFRVELGEIEALLDGHPAVREAVVVTREDAPGQLRLLAYVAADPQQRLTAESLRAYLEEKLPDYMLPSAYLVMDRLPLTANRKIDRAALALSYVPAVEPAEEFVPARTPAEELVARIWEEVLCIDKVGIHSNFFSLGGHSLLATQIILQLREIFRVEIPVRGMFDAPTVSGVVKLLSELWGGSEIIEEIAWTFLQVEQLSDQDANAILEQRNSRHSKDSFDLPVSPGD
jgi:amino acid adenylation domain-containing protein